MSLRSRNVTGFNATPTPSLARLPLTTPVSKDSPSAPFALNANLSGPGASVAAAPIIAEQPHAVAISITSQDILLRFIVDKSCKLSPLVRQIGRASCRERV